MNKVYVYVLDTMADWELGYIISELNSGQFFKSNSKKFEIKTFSLTKKSIKTMGGLTVLPDITINDITIDEFDVLLLPGAYTWNNLIHKPVIDITKKFIEKGNLVGTICGATAALADEKLLDDIPHTSNSLEFLKQFSPNYNGEKNFLKDNAVLFKNIITANAAGSLLFAYLILKHLNVFSEDTLKEWYNYFNTGDFSYFYNLLKTLPENKDNSNLQK